MAIFNVVYTCCTASLYKAVSGLIEMLSFVQVGTF